MKNLLKTTALVGLVMMVGCTGKHVSTRKNTLVLNGCSPLLNCVSSTAWIFYNKTAPFELLMPSSEAWPAIREVIAEIPRTEIMEASDVYIHAKCKTRVFRFVDNLELVLQPDKTTVSVRSSSTFALFDFGVNRLRIHSLRKKLQARHIIRKD